MNTEVIEGAPQLAEERAGRPCVSSVWKLIVRNVLRQRSRNLLLGALITFASFVMVYFSQFLAGVHHNFSTNIVALATGDIYVASQVTREIDRNIFDREYRYFRYPPAFAEALEGVPGVIAVHPRLEFDTKVATEIDSVPFKAMAFDLTNDRQLAANFRLVEGRMFNAGAYEVIVPVDFARRNLIQVGDTIRLLAKSLDKKINLIDYEVTGLFQAVSLPAWLENYVYIDLPVARVLVNDATGATRLNLSVDPAAPLTQVRDKVAEVVAAQHLPEDGALDTSYWQQGAEMFTELTGALQLSYTLITTIITLMVAAALAFTTMLTIFERTREVATLAALGASPLRIQTILVGESVVLAIIASAVGIALASLLFLVTARAGIPITNQELSGFLGSSHFYPAFDLGGYIAGLLVPLLVALLASYFFARRASRLPIADALAET